MVTPKQLAKSGTEHAHQTAFFAYCAVACKQGFERADMWAGLTNVERLLDWQPEDRLAWIHAIPNGGSRGDDARGRAIRGAAMKAEGVRQGVADIFLPVPRWAKITAGDENARVVDCCGLYIEMKKPSEKAKKPGSKGGVTDEQFAFKEYVQANGYGWVVCYSWEDAVSIIKQYLAGV